MLEPSFLRSIVDLPAEVREEIVSQLEVLSANPSDRDLDLERLEGSKKLRALRIDATHRIILRLEKSQPALLFVKTEDDAYSPDRNDVTPAREMVIAPVEALEKLLVHEKYLPLTRYLLRVDSKTREVELPFLELEKIINAHLPPEARQFPNWWANQKSGKRAQAFAWMAAGWIVARVDVKSRVVRFKHIEGEGL